MITGNFKNGKLDFGNREKMGKAVRFAKMHDGEKFWLDLTLPADSKKQRGFYHGGVLRLWAYLDCKDYRDNKIINDYHELAKLEFNGKDFLTNGKSKRIGGSTKGKLNSGYLERVINYLEKEYCVERERVLDPKHYKYFDDVIFMNGEFDTYIDYLLFLGWLELPEYYRKINNIEL